ncbi:hypothetical protein DEO23_14005 [Brachybacterium endophyticum]|uniref:Uncharacterized protein n=1 Tax=Brachybacterium endophyticum TaxID=2182385 RepID=A0A2U2RH63_9MICO|nr:hypothetical protein [Brachybacterium endophyticum]PWH05190.1 hypothetical protein DEO23_14005 [Brachybacterium endophyticum]
MITSLIGPRSALFELKYQGGLSTATERPTSFTTTLGGKRKALIGLRGRREWKVSFNPVSSREIAGLIEVARISSSVLWYPADALGGNMLSPQAVSFESVPSNAAPAGLVALPDGDVAQSIIHTGTGTITIGDAHGTFEGVPVRPGENVTVGAWGLNGTRFTGFWRDINLASVSSWSTPTQTFTGWQWAHTTLTPPAGAAYLSLAVSAGAQYARPAVRWGSTVTSGPGKGCPQAIVSDLSEDLTGFDQNGAYGSINATVTEVG